MDGSLLCNVVDVLLTTDKINVLAQIWRESLYFGSEGRRLRDRIEEGSLFLSRNCDLGDCFTFKDVVYLYDLRYIRFCFDRDSKDLVLYLKSVKGCYFPLLVFQLLPQQPPSASVAEIVSDCLSRNEDSIIERWKRDQNFVQLGSYRDYCGLLVRCQNNFALSLKLLLKEKVVSASILKLLTPEEACSLLGAFFFSNYRKDGLFTRNYSQIRDYLCDLAPIEVIHFVLSLEFRSELKCLYRDMSNFILRYDGDIETVENLPFNKAFKTALERQLKVQVDLKNRNRLLDGLRRLRV